MNTSLFIAKRYLFSKKSNNVVNFITGIAIVGVMVGSLGLTVVMSGFNGIENLVLSLFNSFDPQLKIVPNEGKSFDVNDKRLLEVKRMPELAFYCEVIEEMALLKFGDKQAIITMKGVSDNFLKMTRIDTNLVNGDFLLKDDEINQTVLGLGVAYNLGIGAPGLYQPIFVYAPKKTGKMSLNPEEAFNIKPIYVSGMFSIQHDFDTKYMFSSLAFAQQIFNLENKATSVELAIKEGNDIASIKNQLQAKLGNDFLIKDRFEQHNDLYKILKTERWAVFLILSFILIIATFNVLGSSTMLILDKKKDIKILNDLGADTQLIRRIFFLEGLFVSIFGGVLGLALGAIICLGQQQFGWVKIPGSFVLDAYPIDMNGMDFILIFATISLIGGISAWIPANQIVKNLSTFKS